MVAHFWRAVLFCQLGVAILTATVLSVATSLSLCVRIAVSASVLVCLPALLFVAVGALRDDDKHQAPAHWAHFLRATLSEIVWFNQAALVMSLEPWVRTFHRPAVVADSQPVLLIHGFMCNRAVWNRLMRRLRREGIGPVLAVNLEPALRDIEYHAMAVVGQLRRFQAETRGLPVAIVAHSMGGLVARAALRAIGPGVVRKIVTIGSPHHGAIPARCIRSVPGTQMRPESSWLTALNERQEGHFDVPIISIYSLEDWLIRPAHTAILRGADSCALCGVGHMGLLSETRVLDRVVEALRI